MSNEPQPDSSALPTEKDAWTAAQAAWVKWLDHVTECASTCRTHGCDCSRAIVLRQNIRDTRNTLHVVRAAESQEDSK